MRPNQARRGSTLIEVLISTMISLFLGVGLLYGIQSSMIGTFNIQGQSVVDLQARQPFDLMTDQIRNAQPYNSAAPAALEAATTNSISPYTDTAGDYIRYWLNTSTTPTSLCTTVGTTTKTLSTCVTGLTFTYYKSGGAYTPIVADWTTTTNPNTPTTAELPDIAAIAVTMTSTLNGYTRTFYTLIRLRNSPVNPPPYG